MCTILWTQLGIGLSEKGDSSQTRHHTVYSSRLYVRVAGSNLFGPGSRLEALMGDRRQINSLGHAHELTFSCFRNRKFLKNRRYCEYLCAAIEASKVRHCFHLWAYVFMPNHVHLLIYPTCTDYNIGAIMQSIKQSVSRRAIRDARESVSERLLQFASGTKNSPYRFWQSGGGYDRNIISQAAVRKAIDYIHNNPVRAGLVDAAEEWEWSSFSDHGGLGNGLLRVEPEFLSLT